MMHEMPPLTEERQNLVLNNLSLVYACVNGKCGGNYVINYDDLVSAGILGLIKAAVSWKPGGCDFALSATYRIKWELSYQWKRAERWKRCHEHTARDIVLWEDHEEPNFRHVGFDEKSTLDYILGETDHLAKSHLLLDEMYV